MENYYGPGDPMFDRFSAVISAGAKNQTRDELRQRLDEIYPRSQPDTSSSDRLTQRQHASAQAEAPEPQSPASQGI